MKTIQANTPFYRDVYIGTAAEKTALTSPNVLDIFIETDTNKQFFYAGTLWKELTTLAVSLTI